jgi:hypothetical protein
MKCFGAIAYPVQTIAPIHIGKSIQVDSPNREARFSSTWPIENQGVRPHNVADHPTTSALRLCAI